MTRADLRSTLSRLVALVELVALAALAALAWAVPSSAQCPGSGGAWSGVPPRGGRISAPAFYDSVGNRILSFGGSDGAARNDLWALGLADSSWSLLDPAGDAPPPRQEHSVVYDSARRRWIVFGGTEAATFNPGAPNYNDVWALSAEGALTWSELSPTGTPPSPRAAHAAVYDATQDRVLVFGGDDGSLRDDVWALTLTGTPSWSQLSPLGTAPAPRRYHAAAYDAAGERMLIFGGDTGAPDGELWELQLAGAPTWNQLAAAGESPSPRFGAGAFLDAADDRWIVFGGFGGVLKNDVWALSLAGSTAWSEIVAAGSAPAPRVKAALAHDPATDVMYVFGGSASTFQLPDDVSALALGGAATWSPLATEVAPPGRLAHTAVYDPVRDRVLVYGGQSGALMGDVWALSPSAQPPSWVLLQTSGAQPAPRTDHAAVYDPVRDRMLVFGGSQTNETWALSFADTLPWTLLSTSGGPPAARESHTAVYDPVRDELIVFGGSAGHSLLDDVWRLSLTSLVWSELQPGGAAPLPRRDHVAVYDPIGDRMIVYGGNGGFAPLLNDVWALSLGASPAWTELNPDGILPEGPITHAALYDTRRDRLVAFGGSYTNEVWALSLAPTPAWCQLAPGGIPPTGRVDHTVTYDPVRDQMIAFSGHSGLTTLSDTWILTWDQGVGVEATDRSGGGEWGTSYPNPAREAVTIHFTLQRPALASLLIYDASGRRVRTLRVGAMSAGSHAAVWDLESERGGRVASGVYFYALRPSTPPIAGRLQVLR